MLYGPQRAELASVIPQFDTARPGPHAVGVLMFTSSAGAIRMYEAPKLTRLGTFRELTLQGAGTKRVVGDDLVPGIGMDCDGNAPQGDPNACLRS